jgi:hypothetical protein
VDVLTERLTGHRSTFDEREFVVTGELPRVDVRANELLGSVFGKLVEHAVQHTDAGTPRVEIPVRDDERTVTITAVDNGPDIPPDQRDAVLGRVEQDPVTRPRDSVCPSSIRSSIGTATRCGSPMGPSHTDYCKSVPVDRPPVSAIHR